MSLSYTRIISFNICYVSLKNFFDKNRVILILYDFVVFMRSGYENVYYIPNTIKNIWLKYNLSVYKLCLLPRIGIKKKHIYTCIDNIYNYVINGKKTVPTFFRRQLTCKIIIKRVFFSIVKLK